MNIPAAAITPAKPLERMSQQELQKLADSINGVIRDKRVKGVRPVEYRPQTPARTLRPKVKGALRQLGVAI